MISRLFVGLDYRNRWQMREVSGMSTADRITKIETAIAGIDAKLDLGLVSTAVDGISVTIDPDKLRARKSELQRELESCNAEIEGRPDESSYFRPVILP